LPAAIYTTDARGRITFFNQAAVALSGRAPELNSDEWCVTWKLFHTDGRPMPHEECPMAVALKEDRPIREQEALAQRPDGTLVPFMPYPTPIHDSSGAMVGAVNMLVDITDRKRAEDRQRVLIDELNHRVKNTLTTVQSLASQTLRGSGKAADIFLSRLFALSRTHDQLSRAGWEWADFQTIIDDIFAPYQLDGSERLVCSGGPVRLPPQKALLLAMVMHELATNAAKYGSLSVPDGKLNLTWTTLNGACDRRLLIDWRESGGPPVRKPKRQGFGSRLADRAITRELNGEAQFLFAPGGLRCNFAIPLQNPRYPKSS
jgi:PAS domain S-box-containing protein